MNRDSEKECEKKDEHWYLSYSLESIILQRTNEAERDKSERVPAIRGKSETAKETRVAIASETAVGPLRTLDGR